MKRQVFVLMALFVMASPFQMAPVLPALMVLGLPPQSFPSQ